MKTNHFSTIPEPWEHKKPTSNTLNVPPNNLGIFWTSNPFTLMENKAIIEGPLTAAEPKLIEEIQRPLLQHRVLGHQQWGRVIALCCILLLTLCGCYSGPYHGHVRYAGEAGALQERQALFDAHDAASANLNPVQRDWAQILPILAPTTNSPVKLRWHKSGSAYVLQELKGNTWVDVPVN